MVNLLAKVLRSEYTSDYVNGFIFKSEIEKSSNEETEKKFKN